MNFSNRRRKREKLPSAPAPSSTRPSPAPSSSTRSPPSASPACPRSTRARSAPSRWPEPRHRAPPSATAADALCPSTTRARHQQSPEPGTTRAAVSRRALLSLCSALSSPRSLSESALPSHWSRAQLAAEGPPRRSPFLGRWRYGERAPWRRPWASAPSPGAAAPTTTGARFLRRLSSTTLFCVMAGRGCKMSHLSRSSVGACF